MVFNWVKMASTKINKKNKIETILREGKKKKCKKKGL